MIKINEEDLFDTITLQGHNEVTLDDVKAKIDIVAQEKGIPVECFFEEAKIGGMFSGKESVLAVSHPEHQKDYQKFAIVLSNQYSSIVAKIYTFGTSKQGKKAVLRDVSKGAFKSASDGKNTLGNAVKGTASIVGLAMSLGKSDKKLEEEKIYYQFLTEAVREALSA